MNDPTDHTPRVTDDAAQTCGPTGGERATRSSRSPTHVAAFTRPDAAARAAWWAFGWAVFFTTIHGYWALGGRIGFGDQDDPLPAVTWDVTGTIFTVVVATMFAAGLAVPVALVRPWGLRIPRRPLVALMWIGATILVARGGLGLIDDGLRSVGFDDGFSGLSNEQALGDADPSGYTMWSTAAVDACFLGGGLLFGWSALRCRLPAKRPLVVRGRSRNPPIHELT